MSATDKHAEALDDIGAGIVAARETVGVAEFTLASKDPPDDGALRGLLVVLGNFLDALALDAAHLADELRKPAPPPVQS